MSCRYRPGEIEGIGGGPLNLTARHTIVSATGSATTLNAVRGDANRVSIMVSAILFGVGASQQDALRIGFINDGVFCSLGAINFTNNNLFLTVDMVGQLLLMPLAITNSNGSAIAVHITEMVYTR